MKQSPNSRFTDIHFLNLLLVISQCSSLLLIHWHGKGRGVSSGLAGWTVSPKIDMQWEYQKWIYKTIAQVEGYSLLFTTLSQYIDSAVTWKFTLTLCLRKPFKCLKSGRCIKRLCKCNTKIIYSVTNSKKKFYKLSSPCVRGKQENYLLAIYICSTHLYK